MSNKVLLVDDVTMFLDLEKGYLRPSGVNILTATDGRQGLSLCRQERPALVFLDLHMPVMDGAECCHAIKSDAALKETPVIMVASEGASADRVRCLEAGCDDLVTKPLDRGAFLEKARRQLPIVDRRNTRIGCRIKASYSVQGVAASGYVLDLSQQGLYLATEHDIPSTALLDLIFALPGAEGAIIQARGEIAWKNSRGRPVKPELPEGVGVRLIQVAQHAEHQLGRFLRESVPIAPVWTAS